MKHKESASFDTLSFQIIFLLKISETSLKHQMPFLTEKAEPKESAPHDNRMENQNSLVKWNLICLKSCWAICRT